MIGIRIRKFSEIEPSKQQIIKKLCAPVAMNQNTTEPLPVEAKHPELRAAFWITLARSMLALALGLALIVEPEKSRPFLINFIGVFWFVAGLMSLRWGASGERARRMSVVGIVGIVAGVLVCAPPEKCPSHCAGTG